ncbi:MAG: hypothetical protein EWV53_14805, partial [Microcystis panniformis Mp_MB_F_20051200_S9]
VELDVHALFQNIGTQATKRYFLPRLGRVAYFSRYKVGLTQGNPTKSNLWGGWVSLFPAN